MAITGVSASLAGLQAESLRLNNAASNIANMNTPGYHAQEVVQVQGSNGGPEVIGTKNQSADWSDPNGNDVDLSTEAVSMIQGETAYKADLKVIKTQNELSDETLNLIA